jgi:hypothetical protein
MICKGTKGSVLDQEEGRLSQAQTRIRLRRLDHELKTGYSMIPKEEKKEKEESRKGKRRSRKWMTKMK